MNSIFDTAIASALPAQSGGGEPMEIPPAPVVNGVPKLLYTDEDVAAMFDLSVSTVRNRYNSASRWYDPHFPVPRSTDGSGKGRKAAVRWHWVDLWCYSVSLPSVSPLHPPYKPTHYPKLKSYAARNSRMADIAQGGGTNDSGDQPFEI